MGEQEESIVERAEAEEKEYNWMEATILYDQAAKSYLGKNMIKKAADTYKKLGYAYEATLRNRCENIEGELIDSMIWSIMKEEYLNSPCAKAKIVAYDVFGNQII